MKHASIEVARDLLFASLAGAVDPYSERNNLPQFERVGSGAYRTAWLHKPSGIVYKIDHAPDSGGGNKEELEAIEANQDALPYISPSGTMIRMAAAEGFRFGKHYVVAMEYAPDNAYLDYYEAAGAGEWYGLTDMGGNNIRRTLDGDILITDAGLSSSQRKSRKIRPEPEPEPDGPRWVQEYAFA